MGKDFTILENNAMQSIATSAGYMTVPLTSSLAAYMMVTNTIVPVVAHGALDVGHVAHRRARRLSAQAALHQRGSASVSRKAAPAVSCSTRFTTARPAKEFTKPKLLGITAGLTGLYQFLVSDGLQRLVQFKLLRLDKWLGWTEPWHFHERIDDYYYMLAAKYELWIPQILGTEFRTLGLRLGFDAAMLGVGGLMGVRVATSVVLGTAVNFFVLAPIMIARGDIAPRIGPDWRDRRAQPGRDCQSMVSLVGRDHDGGRFA